MISRHPDVDLLVEYAAGSLSTAPCISITTHMQFCESCKNTAESLKDIGGHMLKTTEAAPVSERLLDEVLETIELDETTTEQAPSAKELPTDELARDLPVFVQGLLPAKALKWHFLSPSIKVAPISVGEETYELALHRIKAGGTVPEHDHHGSEITVVLKGSFSDEDGAYQPGDFIVREKGDVHQPFAAQNEECICLSVLEAPIKLKGFKKIFKPFIGFSPN